MRAKSCDRKVRVKVGRHVGGYVSRIFLALMMQLGQAANCRRHLEHQEGPVQGQAQRHAGRQKKEPRDCCT